MTLAERRRHAVDDGAISIAITAGDQRCALGQLVLAVLPFEEELIQSRLHHRHRGRQLFEVDEPEAGIVRRRQEDRRRPARAVGAIAPRDAPQIDGSSNSARTSTYRQLAAAATCRAIVDMAAPGGPHTIVGCRASTRRARTSASSLGRSV